MQENNKKYNTKNREAIMEYLEAHKEHSFSAYDVNEYMWNKGINVNITTIYRNLDKLIEEGAVTKYKTSEDGFCRYQYALPDAKCESHIHMQCRECGKILHLECHFMEEIKTHLYEYHGFELECHGSVLMGLCRECSDKDRRILDYGNVGHL
jgi:Fur family ferric uptake transcriptional regulator